MTTGHASDITDQHIEVMRAIHRGENPVIVPRMRWKMRRLMLIVAVEPPRAPRPKPGRQRAPKPRRHQLTALGLQVLSSRDRQIAEQIAEQTRHDVAASVARHAGLEEP